LTDGFRSAALRMQARHRQVGPVPGGGAGTPPDPLAVTAWAARWRSAGHPCA